MTVTPQGQIYLCKTPLKNDYKNQLTFSNPTAQYNYFNTTIQHTFDNYTYIKKDNIINVGKNIDEIINCNYLFYKNTGFTNKYYYCFITNMEYINENCTRITFETDCWQTWQFQIQYNTCFVEREHVNNDTIGLHTIPENLDTGDMIEVAESEDVSLGEYFYIAIASSYNPSTGQQFDGVTMYNRNFFANQIFLISGNNSDTLKNLRLFILKSNSDNHIEDIQDIFIIPDALVETQYLHLQTGTVGEQTFNFYTIDQTMSQVSIPQNLTKLHTYKDYTPKNNKCFCYPYNYLYVSNNNGAYNIYKYEEFYNTNATFNIDLAMGIGCSGRLVPLHYKNQDICDDESIPLAKYPTCGWSADSYINWLTQNSVNMRMPAKIVSSIISPISSGVQANAPTANPVTSGMSIGSNLVSNIMGIIGEFREAKTLPNIGASDNTGNVSFASNRNTFTLRCMQCKVEYIKIIDMFFSMFGYKVNTVKIPNITGRQNWNYIKTVECNFSGDIPQIDLNIIKTMFNNGVTLWHNTNTIFNYNNSNNII